MSRFSQLLLDVKQVQFHPANSQIMISASLDGLVSVFDFSEGVDEEEAFKVSHDRLTFLCCRTCNTSSACYAGLNNLLHKNFSSEMCSMQAALNWDASIARMGFCGSNKERLWLTSNTEGLCLWEWQAACDEEGAGAPSDLVTKFQVAVILSERVLGSDLTHR